jgi:hypothetical protein
VLPLALFYGGLAQFLAGMWEFRKGNTFGALAFTSFGSFWLSFAAFVQFVAPQLPAASAHQAVGLYLLAWAIFTAYMTIARENVVTAEGFDLLPGAIVDQHFVRRRRNNRLLSLVLEHPERVGVGIDESTALEAGPDGLWRVLGASVAVVFDARRARITPGSAGPLGAAEVRLHVLPAGSVFDPRNGNARLPPGNLRG